MEKLINKINKGDSIYTILVSMMRRQYVQEIFFAHKKYKDGELTDYVDEIKRDYAFNKEMLFYIKYLEDRSIELKIKLLEVINYTDNIDLSNYNAMKVILACAVSLSKLENIADLDFHQLYLLSSIMVGVPTKNYNFYGKIVGNHAIIDAIQNKTNYEKDQRAIYYNILDYCDEYVSDDMNDLEYANAISDCMIIIKEYELSERIGNQK